MTDFLNANRLGDETSPYLRQHETNPVHWQPWRPEVLAAAGTSNKPIHLSVGYAACHWCHVMAHESFEDDEVAALLNEHFVNIKVDREERPDLDNIYQRALAALGGQGGWPLTMFLTPRGEPFWGGTYFPKEPNFGRPGFKQILIELSRLYQNDQEKVAANVGAISQALENQAARSTTAAPPHNLIERVADALFEHMDKINGGLSGAPKFPQAGLIELYQNAYIKTGNSDHQYTYETALVGLCQGGIYDHIGGGFSRYSVDEKWLAPHFEKMLYDNAQILTCLTTAWRISKSPLFEARARQTIGWLLSDMRNKEGGFTSSFDADSEGEEGTYYVWTADEIKDILMGEFGMFAPAYDVTETGNWEGKVILNRLQLKNWQGGPQEAAHAKNLARLYEARTARQRPGWDDKILTDWNGLMIGSLTEAAMTFAEPTWLEAAKTAFDFICAALGRDQNRLFHTFRSGRAHVTGMAEDYANMASAALTLSEATGDISYTAKACAWADVLEEDFAAENGGFFSKPEERHRPHCPKP